MSQLPRSPPLVIHLCKRCVEKGISPYWDCSPDNTGSIGVAKTIGLSSSFDYKIFWYNLT
ncbi:GNAT family N-acetyltransferase [Paenibacillus septentrionalis]|uniref:GNAT family N-acetyltransferase n=1 Tax=Paenibacillus septentrionalis TaxID=429342 RepID=A0ABW1V3P8_9BACL